MISICNDKENLLFLQGKESMISVREQLKEIGILHKNKFVPGSTIFIVCYIIWTIIMLLLNLIFLSTNNPNEKKNREVVNKIKLFQISDELNIKDIESVSFAENGNLSILNGDRESLEELQIDLDFVIKKMNLLSKLQKILDKANFSNEKDIQIIVLLRKDEKKMFIIKQKGEEMLYIKADNLFLTQYVQNAFIGLNIRDLDVVTQWLLNDALDVTLNQNETIHANEVNSPENLNLFFQQIPENVFYGTKHIEIICILNLLVLIMFIIWIFFKGSYAMAILIAIALLICSYFGSGLTAKSKYLNIDFAYGFRIFFVVYMAMVLHKFLSYKRKLQLFQEPKDKL